MDKRLARIFPVLIAALLVVVPIEQTNAQTLLYGTTGGPSNPGNLYTVDPATGFATLVGALRDTDLAGYAVTGIAFGADGVLYGSTSANSPTAPGSLVTIDPTSGFITVVGAFGITGTMADLTFDSANNTLYGGSSSNTNLYSINLTTGGATLVGVSGTGVTPIGVGLAADAAGTIYGTPGSATGKLFTYSTSNGAATAGPTLVGAPFGGAGSINALAFDSSSVLYGVDVNRNDVDTPRASDLVRIDTATGTVTTVGAIVDINGNLSNFDAIVFAVPESSTWLVGALSLGVMLFRFVRRIRYRDTGETAARS